MLDKIVKELERREEIKARMRESFLSHFEFVDDKSLKMNRKIVNDVVLNELSLTHYHANTNLLVSVLGEFGIEKCIISGRLYYRKMKPKEIA